MKIRTIAFSTLGSFRRNKLMIVFGSIFLCIVLIMMVPLLGFKAATTAENASQMHEFILNEITVIISLVSGFGSLLAAWAAADAVATEMKSGTILAVMARPLHRWQFLAGKYLGVLMLMAIYVVGMFGLTLLLAWMGGQRFHTSIWTLLVYPLVRYAIWAAFSMLLVTVIHPLVVMGIVIVTATLVQIFQYQKIPAWIRLPVHLTLPMTNLLSEDRFMEISKASLRPYPWSSHLTALAYGVDYALVCFVLAVLIFQRRSLTRD